MPKVGCVFKQTKNHRKGNFFFRAIQKFLHYIKVNILNNLYLIYKNNIDLINNQNYNKISINTKKREAKNK